MQFFARGVVRGMMAVLALGLSLTVARGQSYSTFATVPGGGVRALAFDSSGNLYVGMGSSTTVARINITNGAYVSQNNSFVTGLTQAVGLAFDTSGNLYVAGSGINPGKIFKATSAQLAAGGTSLTAGAGGAASTFLSTNSILEPWALAFDTFGNLWATSFGTAATYQIPITGGVAGTPVNRGGVAFSEVGVVFDTAGNLYLSGVGANAIRKQTPTGTVLATSWATPAGPYGEALDVSGNLFVALNGSAGNNTGTTVGKFIIINGVKQGNAITVASGNGISGPAPIAFDTSGYLYVGNYSGGAGTTIVRVILLPTVTAIAPAAGPPSGGTSVTITGTSFTAATAVTFGAVPAASYVVNSQTSITAVAPAGTGTVDVRVTTAGGTSTAVAVDQFTYTPTPSVTAVSPAAGLPAGGTSVIIAGTNFTGATAVKFGTVNATSFVINSQSQITAVAPAGTLGTTVDVTVTTPGGTTATSTADNYTYENIPTVTAVSPSTGGVTAGTSVTITGTGFTAASAVNFGGNAASSYVVVGSTSIFAVAPAGTPGTVDVTVTNPVGTSPATGADNYTYYPIPAVTGVSPSASGVAGGGTITITGTNLSGASAVNFGTVAGTVTAVTATSVTVTVPPGSLGTYDVTVTTPGGTSATTSSDQFTYEVAPVLTTISPTSGPLAAGTTVTITGTSLAGATAVNFGGTAATTYIVNSSTSISATTPAGSPGTINVTVTTPIGTTPIVSADQFTYYAVPVVTSLSPVAGSTLGGTTVTITGTGFAGLSGASAVKFGTVNATSYTVNSTTSITATAPAGAAGVVDVTVTGPGGASATSANDQFTYETAPTVATVSPNLGPVTGGTSVTITGTNFTGVSAVQFGGTNASSFVFNNSTTITATAPAGTAGPVDITVTTPVATSATNPPNDQFTYYLVPTVTAVSPVAGAIGGGGTITITGTGFTGATSLTFGGTTVTSGNFTVVSATQITVTLPAGTAGTVDVAVVTPGGTSATNSGDKFTYEGNPTVASLSPSSGPLAAGTVVVITGTNFTGASAVTFGTAGAASAFTVLSATTISATAPAGTAGAVDVTVTTPVNTSATSGADQYTYTANPAVSSVTPAAGPPAGGTSVIITGTGFTGVNAIGAAGVKFGATNATSYTVNSATQITATAPAGTNTVDVTVTNAGGTSATSTADQFTYETAPTVTAVSPTSGPLSAGTVVTITGTNFTGASSVNFGATNAVTFSVTSSTTISATAPAGTAGPVDVRVTTPIATSAVNSPADQYTYTAAPTVTAVSPAGGATGGGATITITGTGFTSGSTVNFGSTAATGVTFVSATQLTATNPAGSLGIVNVTVSTTGGTSQVNTADQFTYEAGPTVTGLSPAAGPLAAGNVVTITGTNFTGATAVTFGTAGAATAVTVVNANTITATAPAGSVGTVLVTVTTPAGTSTGGGNSYAYTALPVVSSLSPSVGALAGTGTTTITGTGLLNASAVNFGPTPATSYVVNSASSITATVPAIAGGNPGVVDVSVTTTGGTSATNPGDKYTYEGNPTVTGVSPTSGPLPAGTSVTITGTNFTGATAVTFGAAGAASSFVVTSANSISAIAPTGTSATGTVDVTVTTPVATSAANPTADQFTYVPAPSVTSLDTTVGSTGGGGTAFNINGTGFTNGSTVSFGGVALNPANYTVNSSTSITVNTVPSGTSGTVNVTVTTTGGTSAANAGDLFTFEGTPTVTAISPASGPLSGGATVTITGTGFTGASAVSFGNTTATYVVTSSTSISATVPAGTAGTVDVTVTTPVGTSAANAPADSYTYFASTTVTSVSPASGAATLLVTITGTSFTGATGVKFGPYSATAFTVVNATTITATVPATVPVGASGTVDVVVTNPSGASAATPYDQFMYVGPAGPLAVPIPAITSPLTYSSPVNQPFSYTIFATNNPTSFNAVAIPPNVFPPGLFVNTATGGITGTPTVPGTYTITIVASNAGGGISATLVITITAASTGTGTTGTSTTGTPGAPVITSPLTYSSPANQPFSYTIFATNLPTSYNAVAVAPNVFPPGLYINTYTGGVTGTPTTAGTYPLTISATNSIGTGSATVLITITPGSASSGTSLATPLLVNLSARSMVTPSVPLTAGFIIAGPASKTVVLRGVGPGMSAFGLAPTPLLATPKLTLMDVNGNVLASNTGWGGSSTLTSAFAQVGAFPLTATSADSALVATLPPGVYTMRVSDAVNDSGGLGLAELYDASIDLTSVTKLINLSSRGQVMPGNGVLVCGFIVAGNSSKALLIRGVGPSLANYGLTGLVADPLLNLYNSSGTLVATNNDWGTPLPVNSMQVPATAATLASTAAQVGAFPLTAGSKDAAVIITLAPGAYTAQVSGNGGATGLGLVEVYEIAH